MGVNQNRIALANGRYLLIDKLGGGGVTAVYKSWDVKLRVWRAVKVLTEAGVLDSTARESFQREVNTLAKLEHRHVVRVFDAQIEHEPPFIVMELIRGSTLERWCAQHGAVDQRQAVLIGAQLARALAMAHRRGVVHGSVAPNNVYLSADGVMKLASFGVLGAAESYSSDRYKPKGGFLAPEVVLDRESVTAQADVFGIGAIIFHLVTGQTPGGVSEERSRELLEGVSGELVDVVLKMLRPKPTARPVDASSVVEVLLALETNLPRIPVEAPLLSTSLGPLPPFSGHVQEDLQAEETIELPAELKGLIALLERESAEDQLCNAEDTMSFDLFGDSEELSDAGALPGSVSPTIVEADDRQGGAEGDEDTMAMFLKDRPKVSSINSVNQPHQRGFKAWWLMVVGVALVLFCGTIGLAGWWWMGQQDLEPESQVEQPQSIKKSEPEPVTDTALNTEEAVEIY